MAASSFILEDFARADRGGDMVRKLRLISDHRVPGSELFNSAKLAQHAGLG